MALAPEQVGIGIRRHFTEPGVHPYDTLEWERRDAHIPNWKDGTDAFRQDDVEFPVTWSQNSTNIVAQKYFRGTLGTDERETSLRQVIDRVADTITSWGVKDGYFIDEAEGAAFRNELKAILVTQRAAFNSPVWFNIGVKGVPQQGSACFILAVDDTMDGILNWYREEGTIFKGGSGSGINLSNIRSSQEHLKGGGTASGPVSFMRGADASAGTIKSGGKTRRAAKMVILNADHPDVEEFIWCKSREEQKARALRDAGFDMDLDGIDSHSIQYQNANNSVRVTDEFMRSVEADDDWNLVGVTNGVVYKTMKARELFRQISQAAWECADPGMQFDTTINKWHTAPNTGRINGSNPCSEYMHIDNSACNLASINLLKYLDDDGTFDVEGYKHTVEVMFTAQEIIVGNADYPTEKIAENSRKFRQLGLGYANLGALLMAQGMPYDSEGGRAWAAALTALMTGHAYATSARTAGRMGPFAGYAENADAMNNVLRMHRAEAAKIDEELVPHELLGAAQQSWDEAVELGETFGVRNSQATRARAHRHHRPDDGLRHHRHRARPRAHQGEEARRWRHDDDRQPDDPACAAPSSATRPSRPTTIVAHINEQKTIFGAPHFKAEHLPVFACSMGDNTIHYMGHVKMMGAVQPFISGAISKTVNMPEEATIEDVEELHLEAWKLGLKAVALYRDNCKVAQPLATQKKGGETGSPEAAATALANGTPAQVVERIVEHVIVQEPVRQKLPRMRNSKTFSFRVADCHGYATVGEFEDGRPGEVFLKVAKQGSTLAGIMDAFAISLSLGLQYGVPLEAFAEKFTNMRFEPAGMTDDPDLRIATSLVDYIFRRLVVEYVDYETRRDMGVLTVGERTQPTLPGVEEAAIANETDLRRAPARRPGAVGVDHHAGDDSAAHSGHARDARVGDGALPRLRRHHARAAVRSELVIRSTRFTRKANWPARRFERAGRRC